MEDAYWNDSFDSLNALKGIYEISLEVSVDIVDEDAILGIATELVEKVLQRLL